MKLPELSHLQFFALVSLGHETLSGENLRKVMGRDRPRTLAAFYQLMARLEQSQYVVVERIDRMRGNQHIQECRYTLTTKGRKQMKASIDFYEKAALFSSKCSDSQSM